LTAPRVWLSCFTIVAAVALEMICFCPPARAAGDPYLEWWTLETPHYRVHYYKGLEPIAEKVAAIAEGVNRRLSDALGWQPSEVTEIVLTDGTDDANGFADAFPYNAIHLFTTAPDDLSPLGDYDDWYLELVTHENTHVLHTDNVSGFPALANKIIGKWWLPNRAQPRWILEGLAVVEESRYTGGGRSRSSIFDMYLRADVLEKRLASLDQVSNFVRRWPQGHLWYLYGDRFLGWIADVYGDAVLQFIAQDYGSQVIPWGINRSIRRATGQTYEELYRGWSSYLDAHYREQVQEAESLGIREGVRLTHHGQIVAQPRFVPDAAKKTKGWRELLYFRDDGHSRAGFYRLPLDSPKAARESDEELVIRAQGHGSASYADDGSVVFNTIAVTKRIYAFNDLFFLPKGVDAPTGYEPERKRLTEGERAQDPDVNREGTEVVFTENHRGTTTLMIAGLTGSAALKGTRVLVPSARFDQAYTPRFSPDGKWVVYSSWAAGGYRDIRLVEVATGKFFQITNDRAMDWEPTFSPDGRFIFFASDRVLGIPNIFAFDRTENQLWQVTNVRGGALYPAVSPDGKTLVYVGYTSYGHDLFSMEIDRSKWLEPAPYVDIRPDPPNPVYDAIRAKHRYNPWPTLRPRSWSFDYGPGSFGTAIALRTAAGDVVGHHAFSASVLVETERGDPQGAIGYAYGRLPFDFRASLYRTLVPYRLGGDRPMFIRQNLAVSSGIGYALPSEFEGSSFSFSYTLSRFDGTLSLSRTPDPYEPVQSEPARGQLGSVHVGWSFSNAESYLHSIGGERGFSLSLSADVATPALASDYSLYVFGYNAAKYFPMPWGHHHTLAMHASAAIATGDYPDLGVFYTGGFVEAPVLQSFTLAGFQGPCVLRGYAPFKFLGSQYHLYNAEYRFPIVNVDRGLSTLPLFLNRVSGAMFADYGGAFYDLDPTHWTDQFHLGVGGELWIDFTIGYFLAATLRIGYARGVDDVNAMPGGQTYFVLSAPF